MGGDLFERLQEYCREPLRALVERQVVREVERGGIGALQRDHVAVGRGRQRGSHVVIGASIVLEGKRECQQLIGLAHPLILSDGPDSAQPRTKR